MKIDPLILAKAASCFGIKLSGLRPLGGMEGMALEYKRGEIFNVLKVIPRDKDNPNQMGESEAKIEFINYLAENGVAVARPLPSHAGNWVESVETEDKIFLITATTKAAGRHIQLANPKHATPQLFQSWGQVTGEMHRLAKTYESWQKLSQAGEISSPIDDWKSEHEFFKDWCPYDDIREKWVQLGIEIETLPVNREGYGLIHNDLHPWNFLVDSKGRITVIDFDVCSYNYFLKDIAIALFFANWNGVKGNRRSKDDYLTAFFQNFMKGYSTENELDAFWFQHLPLFLKHHQILLFTVFTNEWKTTNLWQSNTLARWKRQIQNDVPVVNILFH
jgi:Ser/Thr protein kinase RdoA (MazF antagonist)